MGRIADLVALRLSRGYFGRVARQAVREHPHVFGDRSRVRVGENVVLNDTLLNTVSGTITIERGAFFGHGVCLLTGAHDISQTGIDRQNAVREDRNIVIGEGAWLASNVTVLGPCRIGRNAVVAAGAVVTEDVVPDAIVGGVPAHVIGSVTRRGTSGWS